VLPCFGEFFSSCWVTIFGSCCTLRG
jgi:hypothetical protein